MAKKRNRSNRPRPPGGKSGGASPGRTKAPADAIRSDRRVRDEVTAGPKLAVEERGAPAGERAPAPPRAAREPAFWFGFDVAWAKLSTARFVVFGLLAVDAFLQLRHAPRARWLASAGRVDEAVGKAKQATFAEPSDAEARSLLQDLLANRVVPERSDRQDDPDQP